MVMFYNIQTFNSTFVGKIEIDSTLLRSIGIYRYFWELFMNPKVPIMLNIVNPPLMQYVLNQFLFAALEHPHPCSRSTTH